MKVKSQSHVRAGYVFYSNNSYNETTVLRKANSIHRRGTKALTLLFNLLKQTFIQQTLLTIRAQFLRSTRNQRNDPNSQNT